MATKESSPELSALAAIVLNLPNASTETVSAQHYDGLLSAAKALAGSVLSQDETPSKPLPEER